MEVDAGAEAVTPSQRDWDESAELKAAQPSPELGGRPDGDDDEPQEEQPEEGEEPVNTFCRTLFQIERAACIAHSYGPEFHPFA